MGKTVAGKILSEHTRYNASWSVSSPLIDRAGLGVCLVAWKETLHGGKSRWQKT